MVATYEDEVLTAADVVKELERRPPPVRTSFDTAERKRRLVENLLENAILFEEGRQAGYERATDIERAVETLRRRLLIERLGRDIWWSPEIPDEELRAPDRANLELHSSARVRASHILLADEATAQAVLTERPARQQRFAELAWARSIDVATAGREGTWARSW